MYKSSRTFLLSSFLNKYCKLIKMKEALVFCHKYYVTRHLRMFFCWRCVFLLNHVLFDNKWVFGWQTLAWLIALHCSLTITYRNIIWYVSMHTTKTLGWSYGRLGSIVCWMLVYCGCVTFFVSVESITPVHGHHHICRRRLASPTTSWAISTGGCCGNVGISMLLLGFLFHATIIGCDWKLKFCILDSRRGRGTSCWFRVPLWVWRQRSSPWMDHMPISILVWAHLFDNHR